MFLAMRRQIRHFFQAVNDSQIREVSPFWKENQEGGKFINASFPATVLFNRDKGFWLSRIHEIQISQLHLCKIWVSPKPASWSDNSREPNTKVYPIYYLPVYSRGFPF